jgi:predicted transcriptional regulator
MTLTIQLSPELEARLKHVLAEKGGDAETYILDTLQKQLPFDTAETKHQIMHWIPEATWKRYRQLIARQEAGGWTEADREEFLRLNDEVEQCHAERLERVVAYGKGHGLSLDQALVELGITLPIPEE